jgi:hypothetical protein
VTHCWCKPLCRMLRRTTAPASHRTMCSSDGGDVHSVDRTRIRRRHPERRDQREIRERSWWFGQGRRPSPSPASITAPALTAATPATGPPPQLGPATRRCDRIWQVGFGPHSFGTGTGTFRKHAPSPTPSDASAKLGKGGSLHFHRARGWHFLGSARPHRHRAASRPN